jgi:hypothetical protein
MTAHSGPRLTELAALAALAGCTGKVGAEALAGIVTEIVRLPSGSH